MRVRAGGYHQGQVAGQGLQNDARSPVFDLPERQAASNLERNVTVSRDDPSQNRCQRPDDGTPSLESNLSSGIAITSGELDAIGRLLGEDLKIFLTVP